MKSQFVSYERALALKELGFDKPCMKYVQGNTFDVNSTSVNECVPVLAENFNAKTDCVSLPLWQQVIDWFREKHHLHITITSISQESWQWHIQFPHDSLDVYWREDFYSYEEAREAAILEAIKLLKEENK